MIFVTYSLEIKDDVLTLTVVSQSETGEVQIENYRLADDWGVLEADPQKQHLNQKLFNRNF